MPSSRVTFFLIRHGLCDPVGKIATSRLPGVHLNQEGKEQARGLVDRLRHLPIRAIYSSPLERTVETATPLSCALDLPVQTSEAFNEVDYGQWSGLSFKELEEFPGWKHYHQFRVGTAAPGGELLVDVQSRTARELETLRARHVGETIAIFSHCDVIRAVLSLYLGSSVEQILRLEIAPASVSILELDQWGPLVKLMNHLGPIPGQTID